MDVAGGKKAFAQGVLSSFPESLVLRHTPDMMKACNSLSVYRTRPPIFMNRGLEVLISHGANGNLPGFPHSCSASSPSSTDVSPIATSLCTPRHTGRRSAHHGRLIGGHAVTEEASNDCSSLLRVPARFAVCAVNGCRAFMDRQASVLPAYGWLVF